MNLRSSLVILLCIAITACATTAVDITGTTIVQGTVVPLEGVEGCYILEVGRSVRDKAFYQLDGDASTIKKCLDRTVSVRIRIDSLRDGRCPVGVPATLVEILER